MAPTRIGFDARFISDRYHGIGRYAFGLLEAMSRLESERSFVVYVGKDTNTRFDFDLLKDNANVELKEGPWPMYWPQEHLRWLRLLKRDRLDGFHSPYFVGPLLTPAKMRNIITIHDLIFDRFPQYMPSRWLFTYYRWLMRLNTRKATRILTVSDSTARDFGAHYSGAASKVRIVTEGKDVSFRPLLDRRALEPIRQKYHLPERYIFSIGARRPHKNQVNLIRAYSRLHESIPHGLVIAAPTDRRFPEHSKTEAEHLGIGQHVHFLDWICEQDLPGLYNLADLVVLPSLAEGFGLPALEAMACGIPIVAADNSSFPEVIGEAGILVDAKDAAALARAMKAGLAEGSLRKRLSAAGLERARHFTWEKAASQVIQIYSEIGL